MPFLLLFVILFGMGANSYGETIVHQGAGIEMEVPSDWAPVLVDGVLSASSPDSSLRLLTILSEQQVVEFFTDALTSEISTVIELPEVLVEEGVVEVNGLFQFRAQGAGLFRGDIIDWSMAFVAGARRSLIVLAFGELDEHLPDLEGVLGSIRVHEIQEEVLVD